MGQLALMHCLRHLPVLGPTSMIILLQVCCQLRKLWNSLLRIIGALGTQTTETGKLQFSGLSTGLYLVCQSRTSADNVTVSPYLTTLPVLNEETNTWVYDVRSLPKYEADSAGGGGGGGSSTTGKHAARTDETVNVPDNDVPRAENPIVKAIEDVLVPLGLLPKTGDNSTSIEIMLGITVMSAALLVLLLIKRRRREA
mgnify:CR=1 FL=1